MELPAPSVPQARAFRQSSWLETGALTICSAILHFWHLFTPRAVVFDEAYYLRFAGDYLTHRFMFDVHPPLGRLIFTATAALLGIAPATLNQPLPVPAMRIVPALCGTVLVPLLFLIMRQLGASRPVATLAAVAVLLDNALLVMSRLALPDIFLIVFGLGGLSAFLGARRREGLGRWLLLASSGFLCGCAFSVKWTGASALGVVLAAWGLDVLRRRAFARSDVRRITGDAAALVVIPAAVYLTVFAIHFAVLTRSGPGDTFMSARFQAQLPGSRAYNPAAPRETFWEKLRETHHAIRYGNGALQNVTHPSSSLWYTWPIMKHPIGLWEATPAPPGSRAMIILLGNPIVWWGSLAMLFAGAVLIARRRSVLHGGYAFGYFLLLGAVLLDFVPFAAIKRVMYLYHYMFALVFLIALAAYSLGLFSGWMRMDGWRFSSRRSLALYLGVIALMLIGFAYFLPFTYGWPLSQASWDMHFRVLHPL
jgi:dolichyl-phosphate-mannose-protein mannosyltransferase